MSRTTAAVSHASNLAETATEAAKESYGSIPGWETFNSEQQHFLVVVSMHKSQASAARFIGWPLSKLSRTRQYDRLFQDAIHFAQRKPAEVAIRYSASLLPKALYAYDKFLTPHATGGYDANDREVLAAAQAVVRMNGLDKGEADSVGGSRIYAGSVNMFQTNVVKSDEPVPIQAHVVEEEDDTGS